MIHVTYISQALFGIDKAKWKLEDIFSFHFLFSFSSSFFCCCFHEMMNRPRTIDFRLIVKINVTPMLSSKKSIIWSILTLLASEKHCQQSVMSTWYKYLIWNFSTTEVFSELSPKIMSTWKYLGDLRSPVFFPFSLYFDWKLLANSRAFLFVHFRFYKLVELLLF